MTDRSNAKGMTLEARIVQTLKDDHLMKLVGDEDAITDLVKRAITEALFQPRRISGGYGRIEETDSVAVSAARNIAEKAASKLAGDLITSVMEDAAFQERVKVAMLQAIPSVMMKGFDDSIRNAAQQAVLEQLDCLRAGISETL